MISIGNLAAGGRAKTPLAALVAERLRAMGERPSILSRGYARRDAADGVVVVRDPAGIRADLDRAGDEPLMLARRLPGVAILASSSRYLAGRLAEHHFGCTVHVLDDGFQHFDLHRDADLVVVAAEDLTNACTLPAGRLREPIDAIASADAVVYLRSGAPARHPVPDPDLTAIAPDRALFGAERRLGDVPRGPALAVAGIADPQEFFGAIRRAGCMVAGQIAFADHHRFSAGDLIQICGLARSAAASIVVTTEKDLVRLLPFRPFPMPIIAVPMTIAIDGPPAFDAWLAATIERACG